MLVTPARFDTCTGLALLLVVPLPSWPCAFTPQHQTVPSAFKAQVWYAPAVIWVTVPDSPTKSIGKGWMVAWLPPSWPERFEPQHFTPLLTSTQVCSNPAAIPDTGR